MTDGPSVVRLEIPADTRVVRVARLVASGLATTVGFDVDAVDDLRLAVGELCGVLFEVGDGSPVKLTFSVEGQRVDVRGATTARGPAFHDHPEFALSEQILAAACDAHSWGIDDGIAHFALSKRH
jgi:hypothetical protein